MSAPGAQPTVVAAVSVPSPQPSLAVDTSTPLYLQVRDGRELSRLLSWLYDLGLEVREVTALAVAPYRSSAAHHPPGVRRTEACETRLEPATRGVQSMATMSVLKFETEAGPKRVIATLERLQKEGLIIVLDAATVERHYDGTVKVHQEHSLVGAGALGGAFWGMLVGLLFLMPWMGLAIGSVTGALAGHFSDYGIDDDFIKEVGAKIGPGNAGLFLLTTAGVVDKVAAALADESFEIVQTNLSAEDESALRRAFGAAA
jgi:uncharacterized membrane protein